MKKFLVLILTATFLMPLGGFAQETVPPPPSDGEMPGPIKLKSLMPLPPRPAAGGNAEQNLSGARDYNAARQNFLNARAPKSAAERADRLAKAKDFALALLAKIEAELTKLKEKISASQMPAERKARMTSEIDAALAKAAALETEVNSATDFAALKKLVNRVREAAQKARFALKRQAGELKANHSRGAIERLKNALDKIESALTELEQDGTDVGALKAELEALKIKAANLLTSAQNTEDAYGILKDDDKFQPRAEAARAVTDKIESVLKNIFAQVKTLTEKVKALNP